MASNRKFLLESWGYCLLKWEGFVDKVGFASGAKEWRSNACWEWWLLL